MQLFGSNFSQRFIALTLVGYLTAVFAAAVAVWTGAAPILKGWQDQTIRETADANAHATTVALREIGLQIRFLANNPEIVKVAVGDESSVDRAADYLHDFSIENLVSLSVLDFEARTVLSQLPSELRNASFQTFEHRSLAKRLLSNPAKDFLFSFRPDGPGGEIYHFLIAQPVRQNGFVEGVLLAEVWFHRSVIFSSTDANVGTAGLLTGFQASMNEQWSPEDEFLSVAVGGSDFFVVLRPDRETLSRAGEEIVSSVLRAVGFFLALPFAAMCFAGLRSIVAPHKALERSQSALRENQFKLRELAEIAQRSNEVIIATDLDGLITWVNPTFTTDTGFEPNEVLGKSPGDVLQGKDTDPEEVGRIRMALKKHEPIRSEILNYRKDGTPYWNALSIAAQFDNNGEPYRFVAISSDVTEKRLAQDEILAAKAAVEHQANHDALTGLPNRRALDAVLENLKDDPRNRLLIRVDLDHFKNVNDTFGHAAGDHVLMVVSEKLKSNIRDQDLAARVGGDEFVILMGGKATPMQASILAERLLAEIQKEILFEDKICRIGASFGIACARPDVLSNSELLLGADAALYVAKERGRNQVVSYTDELHADVVATRKIAKEIETAFLNDEFEPFFQPQFDAQTFEFKGVEALVRWRHPERGILPPGEFLSTINQLSVSDQLDTLMLRKGLEAVAKLKDVGLNIPKVSFNVMAGQLETPDIPEIAHSLAFEGTKVAFEVLETVLIEEQSELFQARVEFLRDIGFDIEVDDFGSGHASIIGLTKLGPDAMKIDQRLIFPITYSQAAYQMVSAVVEIGRALDISITAEGVETAEHARLLGEAGCATLQGFLFAKPMSAEHLAEFLKRYDASVFKTECFSDAA